MAECPTHGIVEIGTTFNVMGISFERRMREPLGEYGGMPPKKIFKSESLKTPFPALSVR